MKKPWAWIAIFVLLLLVLILMLMYVDLNPTGQTILDRYTYTRAICNETNFCQDNLITCQGNQTITIQPITGAVVQHDENWIDPRENKKLCE